MGDLPEILGHAPLKLLAEEALLKMIHDWLDKLYESEFIAESRNFPLQLYTVAALTEHIKTYPLNAEYQEKLILIARLVVTRAEEQINDRG
ncbi:MAG: hypothetical protein F6K42_15525 [Leptolyngbya sp. SIO1D8]|nr:hypothetical protein [Leptolyngbya sp. SIO1D8]